MTTIDWLSNSTEILFNSRMHENEQRQIADILKKFSFTKGHIWVATSGSTSLKWVALSKNAILASAKAVNAHLMCSQKDIWINPLPDFHVGGMGINVRGYLSATKVISASNYKWDPLAFHSLACTHQGSLTALVPTQVHDLVVASLQPPASMRAVIVGGGSLGESLYHKALALGWPLLPSYGLTECCSQVATAPLESVGQGKFPGLKVLSHMEAKIDGTGLICVKGESLLTGYVIQTEEGPQYIDPKKEGWFQTEDLGSIVDGKLVVLGRKGDFVKIGGESVDVGRLQHILDSCKMRLGINADMALVAVPDERLGHVIHLASVCSIAEAQSLIDQYHLQVLPFERIRKFHTVQGIPRTALNKLVKSQLLKDIAVVSVGVR